MKKTTLFLTGVMATSIITPLTAFGQTITVKSGDTLSQLAVNHKTSVTNIKNLNGLRTNVIYIGQKLKMSASTSEGTVINCTWLNVRAQASATSGVVTTIKQATKVQVISTHGAWLKINVNGKTGFVSSKYIKTSGAVSSPAPSAPAPTPTGTHTVKSGDTLSQIAVRYGTTVTKIMKDNGLKTTVIRIGQKLKVGTGTTPVSSPVTAPTSTYKVKYGDTLSGIAVRYGTTVNTIMANNGLRTTAIFVGQNLKITGTATSNSQRIFIRPTETTRITSNFGSRWGTFHYGTDWAAPGNQKIMAAASGTVTRSWVHPSWGEVIFIKHNISGKTYETIYAHLRTGTRAVKVGDKVQQGQFIGWMGSTGYSTGQHLHFEVHPGGYVSQAKSAVDPLPYIK